MTETSALPAESSRHALATRLLHGGLAIAIITQLSSSQFMNPDNGGNTAFEVHEYAGLAAFALVFGFWLFSIARLCCTKRLMLKAPLSPDGFIPRLL